MLQRLVSRVTYLDDSIPKEFGSPIAAKGLLQDWIDRAIKSGINPKQTETNMRVSLYLRSASPTGEPTLIPLAAARYIWRADTIEADKGF
ncbi:MAG: hypothetical protein R3A47_06365 [Polyangiales bacterium]